VADAGIRWNDLEIAEGFLAPAEEGVAFDVALEFEFGIETEGVARAELIDLDGVIDDEFGGEKRINALGIAAHFLNGFAHRGEIDDGRDAGKVLQEDPGGHEGDFFLHGVWLPGGESGDVVFVDEAAFFAAQEIFKEDAQGERKLSEFG